MIENDDKIIYVNGVEDSSAYRKLKPVPDKYIEDMKLLMMKINLQQGGSSPQLGMKQVYAFLTRFNKNFVSTFTTCIKGCSACCNMDVQLTEFEAEYIVAASKIPHQSSALTINNHSPCPFLSIKGTCSIYNYRPLFCRTYHSLSSPELCNDKSNLIVQYGTLKANMGNIIYKTAAQWIYFQNKMIFGSLNIKDIRDFFPYKRNDIQAFLNANPPKSPC